MAPLQPLAITIVEVCLQYLFGMDAQEMHSYLGAECRCAVFCKEPLGQDVDSWQGKFLRLDWLQFFF